MTFHALRRFRRMRALDVTVLESADSVLGYTSERSARISPPPSGPIRKIFRGHRPVSWTPSKQFLRLRFLGMTREHCNRAFPVTLGVSRYVQFAFHFRVRVGE